MTRRTVALSLAVAMVWVTPVVGGSEASAPPDPSMRSVQVTEWHEASTSAGARSTAAATSDTWSVSEPMDAGDAVLVGADWGGDHDTEVQVRARDAEGWTDLSLIHI